VKYSKFLNNFNQQLQKNTTLIKQNMNFNQFTHHKTCLGQPVQRVLINY